MSVKSLLDILPQEPERKTVTVTRLDLDITLQEIPYNTLVRCRGQQDSNFHYLLESVVSPNFRDPLWFQQHMDCPTPIDAMKRLFRAGEIEQLCKVCDKLNGYGYDTLLLSDEALQSAATGDAVEDLEKN